MSIEVGGHVEPGFEGVRDAFANNFDEHGEVGASYAFYVDGTKVVDIWGGVRTDTGGAYDDDTLQIVFSSTKGAAGRVRAPARAPRAARRRRARRHVLARVRPGGQGAHPGALVAQPPGRVADGRRHS